MNQHRMLRVIKLMEFLKIKARPVSSMSRYLGISERSIYRYLKMYEQLGYQLNKDKYNKYFLK